MEYMKRDQGWEILADEVYKIQKKRKELQDLEKDLLEELKTASNFVSGESDNFRFQRIERKGMVDAQRIYADFHVDIEFYRNPEKILGWKLFKY